MTDTIDTTVGSDPGAYDCSLCDRQAVVLINREPACHEHIDVVMGHAFAPLYQAIGRLVWASRAEGPT